MPVTRGIVEAHSGQRPPALPAPRAAPVKRAPWEPYLPAYFWVGGIAAGGWLAATAEDWAGDGERETVRAGRYLALGGVLTGTVLLIADLGRPERFHHMLRFFQPYSVMSLGSWILAGFGAATGAAATLQVIEDRAALGSRLARLSHSKAGPLLHLAGLPFALLLGSYTGILLASTSTPAWAKRRLTLPPLFLASGAASGLTATAAIVEARSSARSTPVSLGARHRLARASVAALGAELVLSLADHAAGAGLPSLQATPRRDRVIRELTLLAGTVAPLILTAIQARQLAADSASGSARTTPSGRRGKIGIFRAPFLRLARPKKERHTSIPLLAAILALGGGLALRFRITEEGYHSADTAADTWELARERG